MADTSPVNYLAQIDLVELLPDIYGEIIMTPTVLRELSHPKAPDPVRTLLQRWPHWLLLRSSSSVPPSVLSGLDEGEQEAIHYAMEVHTDLLLIDERRGWEAARTSGLTPLGTLGILLQAGGLQLIDPVTALLRLLATTNFRLSNAQRAEFIRKADLLRS